MEAQERARIGLTIVSVISDTHHEFGGDLVLPGGDILLVLGDTFLWDEFRPERTDQEALKNRPRYIRFLTEEFCKYWIVLLVLGNHDFWGNCLDTIAPLVRSVLATCAPNTHLLDNSHVEIDGVRFIGSTLWATYGHGTANQVLIQQGMNDFERIKVRDAETFKRLKLTVPDLAELHQVCVEFIKEAVRTDKPCVLLTHHAPSYLAVNRKRFPDGRFDDAYCANLHELILDNPQIRYWFSGHSHYRFRHKIGATYLAANPRGYFGHESMAIGYNPNECDFSLEDFEFLT